MFPNFGDTISKKGDLLLYHLVYEILYNSEKTTIYCREHVYSFSEVIMGFSTDLDVLMLGLTIVSNPDDLNAYFQVREAFLTVFTFHVSFLDFMLAS